MPDEKEMTVEEMKSLVSLATLLPALLDKISAIYKDIAELKRSFEDIGNKFNNNVKVVENYKNSVEEAMKNTKQVDLSSIQTELDSIKKGLVELQWSLNVTPSLQPKKSAARPEPSKEKKADKKEQDKIAEMVDKLLSSSGGRKTRTLTLINVKQFFKVDDETAEKVLEWLEKSGMYNPATHILKFPKR